MDTFKENARTAGLLYLLLILVAPIRLVYIPEQLFFDDPSTTVAAITAHADLFRLGILTDLFCATLEVFLTLALYRLFKDVDRTSAVLMAALGLVPVPLYFANVFNDLAVAHLLLGTAPVAGFDAVQVASLVDLALGLHDAGIHMLQIFWSAWLFPLALLALRSKRLPRLVAIWLMVNGLAYLALSVTGLILPAFEASVSTIALPAQLGEIAFALCLLWLGLRRPKPSLNMPIQQGAVP